MNLIEQTGAGGEKYLATDATGKRLLTDEDCGNCCGGGCTSAYLFVPCLPTATAPGCETINRPPVYVCADATCGAFRVADLLLIVVGGFCYHRTPGVPPLLIGDVPVGSTLLDSGGFQCGPSTCADSSCVDAWGRRWIAATACTGQANVPSPPPYFLACAVTACDVFSLGTPGGPQPFPGYEGICWKVEPGAGIPESQVPASAPKVYEKVDGRFGGKCCTCLAGCVATDPLTVPPCNLGDSATVIECCCSQQRIVTYTVNATISFSPLFGSIASRSIVANGRWEFDAAGVLVVATGDFYTITEKYNNGQPDQVYTLPIDAGSIPSCAPDVGNPFTLIGGFGGVGQCPCEFPGCVFPANDPSGNTVTGFALRSRTCSRGYLTGQWTLTNNVNGVVEAAYGTAEYRIQHTGRCSGQCVNGAAANRASVLVDRKSGGCASCGDKETGGTTI